jgi:hypothetical protein
VLATLAYCMLTVLSFHGSLCCVQHMVCVGRKNTYGHRLVLLLQDSSTQYVLRFCSTQMRMDAGLVLLLQDSLTVCGAFGCISDAH